MMEVTEVIERLKELGGVTSLSFSEKAEVEGLYHDVLDRPLCVHRAMTATGMQ